MNKAVKAILVVAGLVLLVFAGSWIALSNSVRPLPAASPMYVRYKPGTTFEAVLKDLESKKVIRNAWASKTYLTLTRVPMSASAGTFQVSPGMDLGEIVRVLRSPIRRMVRLPEGWWITRTAERLAKEEVADKEQYTTLANEPSRFAKDVSFKLPATSLEGYLYPDTYDLPPLLGAEDTIKLQLKAFEAKVGDKLGPNVDLQRVLTIASIVELEAGVDEERPIIAGVIENRLKKKMRLEMDATVLYGLGKWIRLGPGVVRTIKSPYNTYLHAGLPPGPIGSPSIKSIEAALKPATHNWLFYVAKPDRHHLFSSTHDQHIRNIRIARAAWRKKRAEEASANKTP